MNKYAQFLTLALALTGASTAVASAEVNPPPNVCTESISCEVHRAVGPIGLADTRSMESAKSSPVAASVATPAEEPPHSGHVPNYETIVKGELAQAVLYFQHLLGL